MVHLCAHCMPFMWIEMYGAIHCLFIAFQNTDKHPADRHSRPPLLVALGYSPQQFGTNASCVISVL